MQRGMVNTDEILPSLHPTTSCSSSTRCLRKCCLQRHTKHPEVKSNLVIVFVKRSSPFHSKILYIIYIFFSKKLRVKLIYPEMVEKGVGLTALDKTSPLDSQEK